MRRVWVEDRDMDALHIRLVQIRRRHVRVRAVAVDVREGDHRAFTPHDQVGITRSAASQHQTQDGQCDNADATREPEHRPSYTTAKDDRLRYPPASALNPPQYAPTSRPTKVGLIVWPTGIPAVVANARRSRQQ